MDRAGDQHTPGSGFKVPGSGFIRVRGSGLGFKVPQNPSRGLYEIVDDRVGDEPLGRLALFAQPVSRAYEHSSSADGSSERDVEPSVADRKRAGRVYAKFLDRSINERATRLPAIADSSVRRDFAVGMVRTIVIRVDGGAAAREQFRDAIVHSLDDSFREEPPRHT